MKHREDQTTIQEVKIENKKPTICYHDSAFMADELLLNLEDLHKKRKRSSNNY